MRTLFLLPESWDLALDSSGNIAVASDIYQQTQDVASACRTFLRDVYYDQDLGIPYFENVLGQHGFPLSLYKLHLEDSAKSVDPSIVSANAQLKLNGREATGSILFANDQNQTGQINL
jgi:hypothetical protein